MYEIVMNISCCLMSQQCCDCLDLVTNYRRCYVVNSGTTALILR